MNHTHILTVTRWRLVVFIFLCIIFAGCGSGAWKSSEKLISDTQGDDPFDSAPYVLIAFSKFDSEFLLSKMAGDDNQFKIISPDNPSKPDAVLFKSIGRYWKGTYLVQVEQKKDAGMEYEYYVINKAKTGWTAQAPVSSAAKTVTTMEELNQALQQDELLVKEGFHIQKLSILEAKQYLKLYADMNKNRDP